MSDDINEKIAALTKAKYLGCFGLHRNNNGEWLPCSSESEFIKVAYPELQEKGISLEEIEKWKTQRSKKGKRKKPKQWEQLREKPVQSIQTLDGGGLVSGGFSMKNGVSTKADQQSFSPRDNDPDVFVDVESARSRSRQLGCIGVSRRVSKTGKTVWMPCTTMTDYARLTGTTSLGRRHQQETLRGTIRTVLKDVIKQRKKSVMNELYGKALGRNLRGAARVVDSRFDTAAVDGDMDGLVQEGTPFERPAVANRAVQQVANAARQVVGESTSKNPKILKGTRKKPVDVSSRARRDIQKPIKLGSGKRIKPQKGNPWNPSDAEKLSAWHASLTEDEKLSRFGAPIEELGNKPDGLSSRFGRGNNPGFKIVSPNRRPPVVAGSNPHATPTNPYAEVGGRAMGQVILDRVGRKHRGKSKPTMYFLGGTTGAGKSDVRDWLMAEGHIPSSSEAAHIDPDFIKMGLPGFDDGRGAVSVHHLSRRVTDKVIGDAAEEGLDTIVEGTGKRSEHAIGAKRRGENVVAHFVYAPDDVASKRMRERTRKTGRNIPDNTALIAAQIPVAISQMLDANAIDEFHLWDNSEDVVAGRVKPKPIATKVPGKPLVIHDQAKWEAFAKGKRWADQWERKMNSNDSLITSQNNNQTI